MTPLRYAAAALTALCGPAHAIDYAALGKRQVKRDELLSKVKCQTNIAVTASTDEFGIALVEWNECHEGNGFGSFLLFFNKKGGLITKYDIGAAYFEYILTDGCSVRAKAITWDGDDAHCCPSHSREITTTLNNGKLVLGVGPNLKDLKHQTRAAKLGASGEPTCLSGHNTHESAHEPEAATQL